MREHTKKMNYHMVIVALIIGIFLSIGMKGVTQASTRVKVNCKKVSVPVGKKKVVKVKNAGTRKLKVSIVNKKIVTVKVSKKN